MRTESKTLDSHVTSCREPHKSASKLQAGELQGHGACKSLSNIILKVTLHEALLLCKVFVVRPGSFVTPGVMKIGGQLFFLSESWLILVLIAKF